MCYTSVNMFYYNILQPGNKRELAVVAAAAAEPNMVTGTHQMPRMEMVEICTQQPFFFSIYLFFIFLFYSQTKGELINGLCCGLCLPTSLYCVWLVCVCVCVACQQNSITLTDISGGGTCFISPGASSLSISSTPPAVCDSVWIKSTIVQSWPW